MINKEFLKELGLADEVIEKIAEEAEEQDKKRRLEEALMEQIRELEACDEKLARELLKKEGLDFIEEEEDAADNVEALREKYPFLFKKGKLPRLVSPSAPEHGLKAEDFKKMGYRERAALYRKNPGMYKSLANR